MDPNFIDDMIANLTLTPGAVNDLRAVQKQWAADLEAYKILEARMKHLTETLEAHTNWAVEEMDHIRKVREMRCK